MSGLWMISYIALWVLFLATALTLVSALRNMGVLYEAVTRLSQHTKWNQTSTNLTAGAELPEVTLQTLTGDDKPLSALEGIKTAFPYAMLLLLHILAKSV